MKFKAILTDYGVALLERRFVPAFEKIGKTCHVYLTRVHITLLHNVLNADGVQAVAQFSRLWTVLPLCAFLKHDEKDCNIERPEETKNWSKIQGRQVKLGRGWGQEVIFDDYQISSQNDDRIAFTVDLTLLSRALKSSVSMDGDKLLVKLVRKRPSLAEGRLPYLTFESKGHRSAIIQDVPISQPLNRIDVQELQSSLDMAQALPRTLVQVPDLQQLQGLVDRLGKVGDVLEVGVTQYGDLHLQVSTPMVSIGSEYQKLRVIGVRAEPSSSAASSSTRRLQLALQKEEASAVSVSMKHFAKSLQCYLTKPDASFCGVAPDDACLLMLFQYFKPGTRQTDNTISLHYRLPVLDQGRP